MDYDDNECPQCAGESRLLGQLGRIEHFRCKQCGWEFSCDVVLPHVILLPDASRELLPSGAVSIEPLPTSQIRRWIS